MAKVEFNFEAPYDEFSINGKEYKVYYDDDSLKHYKDSANTYYKRVQDIQKTDISKLSQKKRDELENEVRDIAKALIELFFGKDTYDNLYEASGRSMINLMTICEKLMEWLNEKVSEDHYKKKQYYTKK